MRVLLLLSGVYPHYMGGVSTWVDLLVRNLRDVEFDMISVVSNPHVEVRYQIPKNVKSIAVVPLWGSERPEEYNGAGLLGLLRKSFRTNFSSVDSYFLPYFEGFLREILLGGRNPARNAEMLYGMFQFFKEHDYKRTLKSRGIWETFISVMEENEVYSHMSLFQAVNVLRTIGRYLRILTVEPPRADVSHCAIASIAGVVGVMASLEYDVPNILTEHGIYYRERLLDLINQPLDYPSKIFWTNFYASLARLNYHFAEKIYPVCSFNSRWQREFGIPSEKIEVVYNGVDTDKFLPENAKRRADKPTVVAVIRIDRLKDTLNLIMAMKHVVEIIPEAKCLIFGPSSDREYADLCLRARKRLGLEDVVHFEGYTSEPEKAYNVGDVVVMSSLSEGFPFALIEGMACGKAIVATDVGGMREALGDAGVLVPARSPKRLGMAIASLLEDRERRLELGQKAREITMEKYRIENFVKRYREIYSSYGGGNAG